MKDFIKYTLATLTGIVLSTFVLGFISILIIAGLMMGTDTETTVKKNSVMMLQLNGALSERASDNTLRRLMGKDTQAYGLDDILSSINKAKAHDDIKGIYIYASDLSTSFASLQEIRSALVDFKESGKFIIAYADSYTQELYYLSSVADKVMLNPKGMLEWRGLAAKPMFLKGLLDKIGVEMQIFKVGTYKSAVEPFISTEMSPANREQLTAYTGSVWSSLLADISATRNISVDSLNKFADEMLMLLPTEKTLEAGLVDTLIYKNDVRGYIKAKMGIDEDDPLNVLGLNEMINVKKNVPKDKSGQIVAVYYAYGDITSTASRRSSEGIASDVVIKDLRRLQKNEDVKAVVLRVNSGGGSAFASEQIWRAVEEIKKEKPVVVSMGDYAASGGYYISCGADWIVASPTTLTGSIGIFGMMPNAQKLLNDKLGLNFDVVKTNEFSDFGSSDRAMNSREQMFMQTYINEGYDLFIGRCAEGRNKTKEEIDQIGQGRIWTGATALELGLIDELGGIERALEKAVELADIDAYSVVSYPEKSSFLSSWLEESADNYINSQFMKSSVGQYYKDVEYLLNLEEADKVQARLPFMLYWN